MQDFEESAVSFGDLLSAVANDPVVLIIFLCCVIDAGRSMNEHFSRMCGHEIDSSAELFEKLLQHVCSTVSKPEWKLKRELLLNQFQYPVSATAYGTSGEIEVQWAGLVLNADPNIKSKLDMMRFAVLSLR